MCEPKPTQVPNGAYELHAGRFGRSNDNLQLDIKRLAPPKRLDKYVANNKGHHGNFEFGYREALV